MRVWVSRETVSMGYGRHPFEIHNRKLEATILEVKEDKVTYAYKTDMDDWLGDNIAKDIPIESFIKAYEPMQETIKFICYQRGNTYTREHKEFTLEEAKEILKGLSKVRIIG